MLITWFMIAVGHMNGSRTSGDMRRILSGNQSKLAPLDAKDNVTKCRQCVNITSPSCRCQCAPEISSDHVPSVVSDLPQNTKRLHGTHGCVCTGRRRHGAPQSALRHSVLNFLRYNMTSYGRRAFSYADPHAWNSLPEHLRQTTSIELFKRSLKTFLFRKISRSAH